jgi:hypothetical protein
MNGNDRGNREKDARNHVHHAAMEHVGKCHADTDCRPQPALPGRANFVSPRKYGPRDPRHQLERMKRQVARDHSGGEEVTEQKKTRRAGGCCVGGSEARVHERKNPAAASAAKPTKVNRTAPIGPIANAAHCGSE